MRIIHFFSCWTDIPSKYAIKEVDVIKKQDNVTIHSAVGMVRVTMPGISLKNGTLSSRIKVLNKETNTILDAVVIDSKNVEVRL